MRLRRFVIPILVLGALILMAALLPLEGSREKTSSSAASSETRTVVDVHGREVVIPVEIKRIVSLAPSITETLYALEAEALLAGRTDYDDYPPEARGISSVGGAINPNLERIAALKPDLVITNGVARGAPLFDEMERIGIPIINYNPQSLAEIEEMILQLGAITGREKQARAVTDTMKKTREEVAARAEKLSEPPRVYIEISTDPLISAGPGSFLDEMVELSGGKNILAETVFKNMYPLINEEYVLAARPDVIILAHSFPPKDLADRPGWDDLPAVKRNLIVGGGDINVFVRSGPRITEALDVISRAVEQADAE